MSSNLWVLCHYIVWNVKLCWQLWFVFDICKIPEKQRTSYKTFLKIDRKNFYITCLWGMEIHITSTVRTTVWRQWNDVNIQWFMQMYEIKFTHFPSVYCQHILFFNLSVFSSEFLVEWRLITSAHRLSLWFHWSKENKLNSLLSERSIFIGRNGYEAWLKLCILRKVKNTSVVFTSCLC